MVKFYLENIKTHTGFSELIFHLIQNIFFCPVGEMISNSI